MADTDDQPDDVDFSEIVAQKMVAEQRQQLRRQGAQAAGQTKITEDNFELHEASLIFNHLRHRIRQFEANLDEDEEIGLQLANFGLAAQLHIRAISYQNPSLIEFHGLDPKGNTVTLIQHIDQLNFMLVAVRPIKNEPYRVGFLEDVRENTERDDGTDPP
ncbi:DUF6173 family protein [Paracoccus methylarcula]|uniref:Uncharacterized protein n=1 Tax=Paracoccus methylarcula TaxID=72022 RepID=A0A422QWM4_9RHOB|nr:DUF6173 family protein [Paracoccus methylarcula]RNF34386.1 hypothetical protein A7A09_010835 [Paracoccus methylarcula]